MSAPSPDLVNSLIPIGLSIPMLDLAAIDALAEIKGMTRSAMARVVISQGLEVLLQEEPQLHSRHQSAARTAIQVKRRQRSYAAALRAKEETNASYN